MDTPIQDLDGGVTFDATLWLWEGDAAWHFVTLPERLSDTIEWHVASNGQERGFGSVRVEVTVGATTWRTSLFPDKGRGAYVLPVKREVRVREDLGVGSDVRVELHLVSE